MLSETLPIAGSAPEKPTYKACVLAFMVAATIHMTSTRDVLPYLLSTATPGCEDVCNGVTTKAVCRLDSKWSAIVTRSAPTDYQICSVCKARGTLTVFNRPVSLLEEVAVPVPFTPVAIAPDVAPVFVDQPADTQDLVYNFTDTGPPSHFYNIGDGTCLARWQYGAVMGIVFAVTLVAGTLPAYFLCHMYQRVALLSIALWGSSVSTGLYATSTGLHQLLGFRLLSGVFQSLAMPSLLFLSAGYFAEYHNKVLAALSIAVYVGAGISSWSMWLALAVGWRWTVMASALTGIPLAAAMYSTVREPPVEVEQLAWSDVVTAMSDLRSSRVARWLVFAAMMKIMAASILANFLPLFYFRIGLPGYTASNYAAWSCLIISFGGAITTLIGWTVTEYWGELDTRVPCFIGVASAVVVVPLLVVLVALPNYGSTLVIFFFLIICGECWFLPTIKLVQRSVRKSSRQLAIPVFLMLATLVAQVGPAAVSFFDTAANGGLRRPLLGFCILANLVAALAFASCAGEITIDPVAAGLGDSKTILGARHAGHFQSGAMLWGRW
mmetsp:Transcript_27500/g.72444  ORF Transcript_27500/g.72444 Transcript_27500/m.72444 type:complete len:552 (-) Transcript_27500:234-1889(-)|eukprot:CAMPEP_0194535790 /NCGR_PEP_ID=MMETSP0253-20130528/74427_1 /TAXON_ID=2966 /ORGANISM="Noctiluca scintillans" /LENGTH=551 /DNA_ID=CAMNT_0039381609 /DNA_START=11 /DNA_END=1666 /DNA_ORIENTATION=-